MGRVLSGASPGALQEMVSALKDRVVRGAGLIEGPTGRRNLMESSVQEKATPEHLLMIGDVVGMVLILGLVRAVVALLELLVKEVLGRLLDKEMLMGGELLELGDGEGLVLGLLRDKVGEVGIGRITTHDLSLVREGLLQLADLGLIAGGGMGRTGVEDLTREVWGWLLAARDHDMMTTCQNGPLTIPQRAAPLTTRASSEQSSRGMVWPGLRSGGASRIITGGKMKKWTLKTYLRMELVVGRRRREIMA